MSLGTSVRLGTSVLVVAMSEKCLKCHSAYQKMSIGNSAVNFSLIGVALGLAFALPIATRARPLPSLLTALLGLLGGATGGAVGGFLLAQASTTQGRLTFQGFTFDPMLQAVLFQSLCWGGIGAGIGAAVGAYQKLKISTGIAAGIAGGITAAVVHAVIGSIFFPDTGLVDLIPPSTLEGFLWAIYCASALALAMHFVMRRALVAKLR